MENVKTAGVKRAAGFIKQMNADDRIQEIARMREKARMAEASAYRKAQKEGLERGRQEGASERSIAIARNMFALGLPLETIIKATGLTEQELKKYTENIEPISSV